MSAYRQPIMGVGDVAEYYGVSKQLAAKWAREWPDWPKPYAVVKAGTFYRTEDVRAVCAAHERRKNEGPRPAGDPRPPSVTRRSRKAAA